MVAASSRRPAPRRRSRATARSSSSPAPRRTRKRWPRPPSPPPRRRPPRLLPRPKRSGTNSPTARRSGGAWTAARRGSMRRRQSLSQPLAGTPPEPTPSSRRCWTSWWWMKMWRSPRTGSGSGAATSARPTPPRRQDWSPRTRSSTRSWISYLPSSSRQSPARTIPPNRPPNPREPPTLHYDYFQPSPLMHCHCAIPSHPHQ
uniref:Uncharacterized protein n=1 Tax=Triticum urartu TaxID=4572 RepID=A0A8R7PF69_TRIUA